MGRRVARFSIAPVRGLGLEHPAEIELTSTGVDEDRRFYLVDETGRLLDRLVLGSLVQVTAHTNPDATTLSLSFPDGELVADEVEVGEPIETPIYGARGVGRVVVGPWNLALSEYAGRSIRLVRCEIPGGTREGGAVSLITDGSLAELARQAAVAKIDGRRFRMLVEVEGSPPHEEDSWIGRLVSLGNAVVRVTSQLPRCAITTQSPDTGARDLDTIRTIIKYRGLRDGKYADFGVLCEVDSPGRIRVGDEVAPIS